jgi:hypothetical protein
VLKIVLTDSPEKAFIRGSTVSTALQPSQPLPSILNLGRPELASFQRSKNFW